MSSSLAEAFCSKLLADHQEQRPGGTRPVYFRGPRSWTERKGTSSQIGIMAIEFDMSDRSRWTIFV